MCCVGLSFSSFSWILGRGGGSRPQGWLLLTEQYGYKGITGKQPCLTRWRGRNRKTLDFPVNNSCVCRKLKSRWERQKSTMARSISLCFLHLYLVLYLPISHPRMTLRDFIFFIFFLLVDFWESFHYRKKLLFQKSGSCNSACA